ncbi:MAG: cupin-like domain-containing protein [Gammaproteobacteria bacterium]|nr:cupin-like domain-containing protein [Gammaproteobacteria bacterium]
MLDANLIENITNNDPNLAVINLSCCDVDDAQVDRICTALTDNTHVHSLLFNWNKLTDIGAYRVAELMRTNHHLERIELAGNPAMTDACIQHLQVEFNDRFLNGKGLRRLALNPYHGAKAVEEVFDLDPEEFITNFYHTKHPIVVRGALKDSQAAKLWTPDYFTKILGGKEAPLSLWSPADEANNQFYHLKKVKFKIQDIMALFADDATINSLSGRFYIQNHPLDEFAEIREHITPPAFCNLINLSKFAPHVWCGQNDTLTQLHFDELDNIFLQVYGQKSVTLFPPTDTPFLFQHKPDKNMWLRNAHRSRIPGTDQLDSYASTHRHATPYHVHMRETDALYIPKRWWHEVRGLSGPSISVNYWFHTNAHCLPEVERLFSSEWMSYTLPEKESIIVQVSKLLLQHDCPNYVFERMPFTLIQVAIRFNMIEVVKQLLAHPCTELTLTPFYCSPLLLAIVFEHHDILEILLKNSVIHASINQKFPGYDCTPLALANEIGDSSMIKQLIACGAT